MNTNALISPIDSPATTAVEPPTEAAPQITRLVAPRGWSMVDWGELWRFRELLYFLAWRDVKVRYKQTLLGAAWALLQPLLTMVVFTVVFGRAAGVSNAGLPYPLFAFLGLLPWIFFSTTVIGAANSVVGSERLITKVYFPRLAIPFASAGAGLVDFCIGLSLAGFMLAFYHTPPGWSLLSLPLVTLELALIALGVGTFLAALNVRFRDFRYVIPFVMQLWMFATPTIYMQMAAGAGGSWTRRLAALNPTMGLISAFRDGCVGAPTPWPALFNGAIVALVVFAAGALYYRRVEQNFADII